MCNNDSASGAYNLFGATIALISCLFVVATYYSETALADDLVNKHPTVPAIEQQASENLKNSPWSTMVQPAIPVKKLSSYDQRAALEAIHFTLREVADGAIFVWRRPKGNLNGRIKPTSSFRDANGTICRHLEFSISHGLRTKQIESIACRKEDGSWSLSG